MLRHNYILTFRGNRKSGRCMVRLRCIPYRVLPLQAHRHAPTTLPVTSAGSFRQFRLNPDFGRKCKVRLFDQLLLCK